MGVVQCGIARRLLPVSPVDQRHSFISYIPIAIRLVRPRFSRLELEAPHRRRRTEGATPLDVLLMSFRQTFITAAESLPLTTSSSECCCVPFPARLALRRQAGQPSPSNQFIGLSRRKCRTRIRRAGHGSKSICAQKSVMTSIRAGLPAWTWKQLKKAPYGCPCRPGSSRAGSSHIMQNACWLAGRRRKTKSLASS